MKLHVTTFEQAGTPGQPSQDRLAVNHLGDHGVLCVLSDGVGTARDPERCSERVVRLISDNFAARPRQWTLQKTFEQLIGQTNVSLYQEGTYLDGSPSMQATVAVVCLRDNRLHGLNVGDSPVLLVRGEKTERLSVDHVVTDAEQRDVLTQAVGMGPAIRPHYFEQNLAAGDWLVITSDGLTKIMDDSAIGELARKSSSARGMIQEAMQRQGPKPLDDLSVILIQVEQLGLERSVTPTDEAPIPQPAKGKVFDGYVLLHRMSGNDRVWLAEKGGQRVVLKFVPLEAETDDSGLIVSRFAREAWNASRLHGEFFVPSRLPEDGSPYYYVMDYVQSPSLRLFLKTRKLSAEEAIALGRFFCRAGQFLLGHELVHGDIKPDNVLIFPEGDSVCFKLLDLGLAAPVFTEASTSGTPTYLAPERFKGATVTERTEIFSVGVTLYEMLTGHPPFGELERFQKPSFGELRRPSRLNPNVPPWLDGVIMKCLSLRQEKRYQCFSELLFALDHPDQAPADLLFDGPLLESNPLLFYRTGFWVLLASTVLLLLILLSWHP